ncbi:hypothetical protein SAMN04489724_4753 [Algoriphagus locisalis]|uniref:Lipocalin-like domain-containing protein n=1 Tax=Algoriphagus locisalis TaxID=305507 RepID=A0A1I7E2A1_9BACT|nr:hypothetical protein [Algoriphagus locisalis]SFU18057.1 hypothetical protein SAMN04489724_4753 [Algoriphagus locisalis]
MKSTYLYLTIFTLVVVVYFTLLSFQKTPSDSILGEWKEVSWEYEKLDSTRKADSSFDYMITDHIKDQISQNLIIHKAETWKFTEDETVEMQGSDSKKCFHWTLKGRGNILQIDGSDLMEHYEIQELSADRMILHFNFDMQVRGIVKMTFEKINT